MISESQIRKMLAQVVRNDAPLKWESDYVFVGDALRHSLDHAAFLLAIQDQLGIVVPDDDMTKLSSIGQTLAYLHSRPAQA